MRKVSFLIGGLIWILTSTGSFAAQSWGVTAAPATYEDGTRYCMLWYGRDMPLMNFAAYPGEQSILLTVGAEELADIPSPVANGKLELPSGRSASELLFLKLASKPVFGADLPEADLGPVFTELGLSGEMTIEVGTVSLSFPVPGDMGDVGAFLECRDAL